MVIGKQLRYGYACEALVQRPFLKERIQASSICA